MYKVNSSATMWLRLIKSGFGKNIMKVKEGVNDSPDMPKNALRWIGNADEKATTCRR